MPRATSRTRKQPMTKQTDNLALLSAHAVFCRCGVSYQIRPVVFCRDVAFHARRRAPRPPTPPTYRHRDCLFCHVGVFHRIKRIRYVFPFSASSRLARPWIPALTRPPALGCPCSTCFTTVKKVRIGFQDGTMSKQPMLLRTLRTLLAACPPLHSLHPVPPHQPSIPSISGLPFCSNRTAIPISTRTITLVRPTLVHLLIAASPTPNCPPATRT